MKRLVALLVLLAVAAGCGTDVFVSEQMICHNMCAPRAVGTFTAGMGCHPSVCTCAPQLDVSR